MLPGMTQKTNKKAIEIFLMYFYVNVAKRMVTWALGLDLQKVI